MDWNQVRRVIKTRSVGAKVRHSSEVARLKERLACSEARLKLAEEQIRRHEFQQKALEESHKRSDADLVASRDQLRRLMGRLISIQDAETKRVARELHDDFSQELAALATESRALKRRWQSMNVPSITQKLEDVSRRIGDLATDIHEMSRRLHPAILDHLGLAAALKSECTAFSQRYAIRSSFASHNVPRHVPEDVALCIYRVAQESLHNVAKHSGSFAVRLELRTLNGEIQLTIRDYGGGFDLQGQSGRKKGLGLVSMEERVRYLNGSFRIVSKAAKGTKVQVNIPLRFKADETSHSAG